MVAKDEKLAAMASSSSGSPTQELKKGPWKPEEDMLLVEYVKKHGERDWNMVRKHSGLARCGKSCRLRWNNHLRPNLRKGPFSPDEEKLICELHSKIGNKWARIAAMLPGRTDNEIKNFWNTRVKRLARRGSPLYPADLRCPQPDLLNHYLHLDPSPSPTSSTSTFQSNLQNQLSPTTPNSHSILLPPSPSPSRPHQFSHYDAVLQDSMALYDAALENSRQQRQQEMFESSFHRFKRHRSVPNLTISVPTVRHVALHPFSPLGFSTNSSPLGGSVSMASSPTATSYMHVTPSPHSYTSSPTGMMVSPTALQLGIPASQPSLRLPLSSPPVVNFRPTCLPRTSSFSFDPMLFDLHPATTQTHPQRLAMDAIDNELAFSVEDLGISLDPDTTTIPPDQSSTQISEPQQPVNGHNNAAGNSDVGAGPVDEQVTISILNEQPEFSTEQAKAFLNELETDWPEESRLNSSISSTRRECNNTESMQELELQDELSNLLCSTEVPQSFWENDNDGLAPNNGVSQSQASHPGHDHLHQLEHFIDDRVGMEMHELLGSSAPVAASTSSWDNMPGIYQPWLGSATS